jgi:hypothetical protein
MQGGCGSVQEKKGGTGAGAPVVDAGPIEFKEGGIVVGVSFVDRRWGTVASVTGTDGSGREKSGRK